MINHTYLRQSAGLIKHLTGLKILQNSLYLDEITVLLDSTKVEINKHIKRQVKSHRYFPAGRPSRGAFNISQNKSQL